MKTYKTKMVKLTVMNKNNESEGSIYLAPAFLGIGEDTGYTWDDVDELLDSLEEKMPSLFASSADGKIYGYDYEIEEVEDVE